jgi:hypothetical protein
MRHICPPRRAGFTFDRFFLWIISGVSDQIGVFVESLGNIRISGNHGSMSFLVALPVTGIGWSVLGVSLSLLGVSSLSFGMSLSSLDTLEKVIIACSIGSST